MNQPRRKAIFFKKRPFFTPFRPEKRALTDTTGIFPHVRRPTRRHYGTNSVFLRTKSDLGKPKAHLPTRYGAKQRTKVGLQTFEAPPWRNKVRPLPKETRSPVAAKQADQQKRLSYQYKRDAEAELLVQCLVMEHAHAKPRPERTADQSQAEQRVLWNTPAAMPGLPLVHTEKGKCSHVGKQQV